jgi:NAD(P)-dependent dehydrogenase (short-subunit alcohol dehydrogenase family)
LTWNIGFQERPQAKVKGEIKLLVSEVEKHESNGVHLLVNNAGRARDDRTEYSNERPDIKSAQSISEHLWKADPSDWAATFETLT